MCIFPSNSLYLTQILPGKFTFYGTVLRSVAYVAFIGDETNIYLNPLEKKKRSSK
jgi:hypothetical protein